MTVPDRTRAARRARNLIFLAVLLLFGCAPAPAVVPRGGEAQPAPGLTPEARQAAAAERASPPPVSAGQSGAAAQAVTAAPLPTSTPDPGRLPPEEWRDWPVVPAVTGRAVDIYRAGLALDLNRHALSKIGDCQSIREVLLGMYDHPGRYSLPRDEAGLAETIQQFQGSFDRDGNAVKGGYNAAAVLSPLWADPETCQPGETPLACELRTQRPVFALISLEVWWKGRTPERYEQYMRQIIDELIANGTVPILSTKADNVEGNHAINLATARLAYEYDLPLWNWWRAAQSLPNAGLDPTRPDGFHISIESWPLRSRTALESIDALWRGLEAAVRAVPTAAPTPSAAPSRETQETELGSLVLAVQPAPGAAVNGDLVFDVVREGGSSQGIFALVSPSPATGENGARVTRLADAGWSLQAVSPDGQYLLANQGSRLALLERGGGLAAEISRSFLAGAQPGALFTPDGSAIAWTGAGGGVMLLPLDGSPARQLAFPDAGPVALLPAAGDGAIAAQAGSCDSAGACQQGAWWILPLDGGAPVRMDGPAGRLASAPRSGRLAYALPAQAKKTGLALQSAGGAARRMPFDGESITGLVWDPAGQRLSVLVAQRSGYSGKNFGAQHFIVNPKDLGTRQLPDLEGLNPLQAWSPDGDLLARAATVQTAGGYRLNLDGFDLQTGKPFTLESADPALASSQFLYAGFLAWLPR